MQIDEKRGYLELITFRMAEQEFCIDVQAVREIRGWTAATPLPHAPPFVLGMINLRGAVLPVLDLKSRLGLGVCQPSLRSVVIVVQVDDRVVGLLVDGVSEVLTVDPSSVQPTPNVGSEQVSRFLRGIIAYDAVMISWIALDEVLPGEIGERAAA